MTEYKIENATIDSTALGVANTDHGILSFVIGLDYGGGGQGFGQIVLDNYSEKLKRRIPTILASSLLLCVDEVWGKDWEDLKGLPCRAYHTWGNVFAIGHYLKDKWLWFDKIKMEFVVTTFKEMAKDAEAKHDD
jgi:hypothetical protein